uniref:Protein phosphatase methylesterase 1 n=1 Tax=Clastoptera arizonana TaxID=38151 RepID=A0A1B6D430_9HEMI
MSKMQKNLITSRMPPVGPHQNRRMGRNRSDNDDYTPVEWNKYFDKFQNLKVNGDTFRVYSAGEEGPVVFLLHGGGFSGLTWSLLAKKLIEMVVVRVVAMDIRGHGDTSTNDDSDLSIERLSSDVINVIKDMYGEDVPEIILMGHSMGGAIAVHVAASEQVPIAGLAMIDVVEGTAINALASMQSFLRGRPQSFQSIEDAIKWSVHSGQLKNLESAKVSMPGQIKNATTGKTATLELENYTSKGVTSKKDEPVDSIREDEEATFKLPGQKGQYVWRIDLRTSEPYWSGWFQGLSQKFLNAKAGKILLLANIDRLDTDLTIGQMQGKFEMHTFDSTFTKCGHAVHEDLPQDVANVITTFIVRNRLSVSKGEFSVHLAAC